MNAIWFLYDSSACVAKESILKFRDRFPNFKIGVVDFSNSGTNAKWVYDMSPDFYEKLEFERTNFLKWECAYGFLRSLLRMSNTFGGGCLIVRPEASIKKLQFNLNNDLAFYDDGVGLPYKGAIWFSREVLQESQKSINKRNLNLNSSMSAEALLSITAMQITSKIQSLKSRDVFVFNYKKPTESDYAIIDFGNPQAKSLVRQEKMNIIANGIKEYG